jgi:hypothetical protein
VRIRAFFLRARFERELKRKASQQRFQGEHGLEAFDDWPAQIGTADQASQAQTVWEAKRRLEGQSDEEGVHCGDSEITAIFRASVLYRSGSVSHCCYDYYIHPAPNGLQPERARPAA